MYVRAAVLAAMLCPSLAVAQDALLRANDPQAVLEAIRAYGHRAKLETDEEGQSFITAERGGVKYWVNFTACGGAEGCLDLQFYTSFDVEPGYDAVWANDWNSQWVVGRVVVNETGDPGLSYFVTTMGGLSQETFMGNMDVWNEVLDGLLADIGWS